MFFHNFFDDGGHVCLHNGGDLMECFLRQLSDDIKWRNYVAHEFLHDLLFCGFGRFVHRGANLRIRFDGEHRFY